MPTKPSETSTQIVVPKLTKESITLAVVGDRPVIINRVAEKAMRELVFPNGRRNAAERAASLKHDPLAEFRASPYRMTMSDDPTLLAARSAWFKAAMMEAALRLPGTKKTEIGQLVWVEGDLIPLYGAPEILLSVTRSADINRTPDIRTRCIVPRWAVSVTVTFSTPLLTTRSVVNLMAAAGQICGVGDWRPQKGKGTFGQFSLVDPDDEAFKAIVASGGRSAQTAAMDGPMPYDQDSADLLSWFEDERVRRGRTEEVRTNGRHNVAEGLGAVAVS